MYVYRSMAGKMLYHESLQQSLEILRPSRQDIHTYLQSHPIKFSKHIKTLVHILKSMKKDVFLVSGGFTQV